MDILLMNENVLLREIEKEFTKKLIDRFEPWIEKVILFGSRAKGVAKPWSDYDILIVLNKRDSKIIDEIYEIVTDFQLEHRVDISLKIYRKDDFEMKNALHTPFMEQIKKTGVVLWSRLQQNLSKAR